MDKFYAFARIVEDSLSALTNSSDVVVIGMSDGIVASLVASLDYALPELSAPLTHLIVYSSPVVNVLDRDTLEHTTAHWQAGKTIGEYIRIRVAEPARIMPTAAVILLPVPFLTCSEETQRGIIKDSRDALASGVAGMRMFLRVPPMTPEIIPGSVALLDDDLPDIPYPMTHLIVYARDVLHRQATINRAFRSEIRGFLESSGRKPRETFPLEDMFLAVRVFESPTGTISVYVASDQHLVWVATQPKIRSNLNSQKEFEPVPSMLQLLYATPTSPAPDDAKEYTIFKTALKTVPCDPAALTARWLKLIMSVETTRLLAENALNATATEGFAREESYADRYHLPSLELEFIYAAMYSSYSYYYGSLYVYMHNVNTTGENLGELQVVYKRNRAMVSYDRCPVEYVKKAILDACGASLEFNDPPPAGPRRSVIEKIAARRFPRESADRLQQIMLGAAAEYCSSSGEKVAFFTTLGSACVTGAATDAIKVILPEGIILDESHGFLDRIILREKRKIHAHEHAPNPKDVEKKMKAMTDDSVGTATPRELYAAATQSPACAYLVQALFHTTLLHYFKQRFPHTDFEAVYHPFYGTVMGGAAAPRARRSSKVRPRRRTATPRQRRRKRASSSAKLVRRRRR